MKKIIFCLSLFSLLIFSCKNQLINKKTEMPLLDINMAEKLVKLSLNCVNKK